MGYSKGQDGQSVQSVARLSFPCARGTAQGLVFSLHCTVKLRSLLCKSHPHKNIGTNNHEKRLEAQNNIAVVLFGRSLAFDPEA